MIKMINDRLRREDEGFTLIELMVVVLIIAILIAIAIPTFLGARGRAQDRAAQSALRNAVTGAKAIFTDNEDYAQATVAELQAAEPSLQFVNGAADEASTDPPNEVSVNGGTSPSAVFLAAARSANGSRCWFIRDAVDPDDNPGTWWLLREVAADADCNAGAGVPAAGFAGAAGDWVQEPGDAEVPAAP